MEYGGSIVFCDCCVKRLHLIEAMYDAELGEFVCNTCAWELAEAGEALRDFGLMWCCGRKVDAQPHRKTYDGLNL